MSHLLPQLSASATPADLTRRGFLTGCAAGLTAAMLGRPASLQASAPKPAWATELFLMNNWFSKSTLKPAEQVELARNIGYTGMVYSIGHEGSWEAFGEVIDAMDRFEMKLVGVHTGMFIHEQSIGPRLREALNILRKRSSLVLLQLRSDKDKRSAATGDDLAAGIIDRLADLCEQSGTGGVAIYPQAGNWVELVAHAVRLAQKLKRRNVGLMFNQYHWMIREQKAGLKATLQAAMPHLMCVTLNGSDAKKPSVLPLGQGDYDTFQVLRTLNELGYQRQVGLMGYGISGDLRQKLADSFNRWNELKQRALD